MPLWDCLVDDYTLTRKLREYSAKYVKIPEADMARSRELVRNCIKDNVMVYCRQNSALPILRLEYIGSVYEGLKTEAADEVNLMVVLKTTKKKVWVEDTDVPGYAQLKPKEDSKFCKYADPEGSINPERNQ